MSKRSFLLLLICFLLLPFVALSENVVRTECTVLLEGSTYSGYYTGEWSDQGPNGYGIFETDPSEWYYLGEWKNGMIDGEGSLFWIDGHSEAGRFEEGYLIHSVQEQSSHAGYTSFRYIGNRNSQIFHYPDCVSAKRMKDSNKIYFVSRDVAISQGFRPCKNCDP